MLRKIALAPTGRILFFSRYPAMLGVRFGTKAQSAYSHLFWIFVDCRSNDQVSGRTPRLERHCVASSPLS
jgi:hypothetical protein